jgi:quercetin dioxygenase-like cupin family protein
VPEHHHVNEQTGMLIRGSLTFRIGEETAELRPGSTWVIPADVPHSVDAGPEGAFLIELFAPPRDDWAGLDRLEPSPPSRF